jgi:PAS domain S-box-containing protein
MSDNFFSNPGFMPHIHCYLSQPALVWTMMVTDLLIGIAYVAISVTLWVLIRRIKIPFSPVVLCFGVFIGACGATHFMEVWTLWNPDYWIAAFIKLLTALASVGTGIYLFRLRHAITSVAEAAKLSEQRGLDLEVLNKDLEERVKERTRSFVNLQTRFEKISQTTDLGIWYCDLPFDELIWNDKTKEHFWMSPEKTVKINDFYDHIHPEDRERTQRSIADSIENHHAYEIEYRTIRPGRPETWKWIRATGWTDYDLNGKPVLFDGITLDITERKQIRQQIEESERRYRMLTETLPQLVWTCLPDGRCDYLSKQWIAFTGVRLEDQLGLDWLERVIHPDDQARTLEHWMGAVKGLHPYDIEYRIRRNDGIYRWFKTRGTPVRNERHEIVYWFGTCTDVQDQHEVQQQLEDAVYARDEFISIASHELKTPLTSLLLQGQLLKREADSDASISKERIVQFASQSVMQVTRLTRLVDEMLDIAKIRTGRLTLEKTEFDLSVLVRNCIEQMHLQFVNAGFNDPKLTLCETSTVGNWDKIRIGQVVNNLLTNALRYGRAKPVEIAIECEENKITLLVKDEGIGIPAEAHDKIFDRFERAVNENEASGLGLGLYITRQIVESHGGKIRVESQVGKGSTFIVGLPKH